MPPLEPEIVAADGTVRKAHYGTGRQPWDDIVDLGWGAQFAAGNVLKYVRRATMKNGDDDIVKAKWYFTRLQEMAEVTAIVPSGSAAIKARKILIRLLHELTESEADLLRG